ncbi:NAD-dependent epimerase/dehydratase family protein [Aeromicrobium phragmitis]|nr:NAD-dependent epimerase/dehydratase family protein [Aeromicrobium phragmitis]
MASDSKATTWVIGASGLLGRAVVRSVDGSRLFASRPVRWDSDQAIEDLARNLDEFAREATGGWRIIWAAGTGVIGSGASHFEQDETTLKQFLSCLAEARLPENGGYFHASSASVYAGEAVRAPFSESSRVAPTSDYAYSKLRQEQLVAQLLGGRVRTVIGRISTLYGPGQNLSKSQGIIAKMCLNAVLRRPAQIYVPLDTLRDYLYVDDAAAAISATLQTVTRSTSDPLLMRVIADGRACSIGYLSRIVDKVSGRRGGIEYQPTFNASHARDLRMRSEYPADVVAWRRTPLSVGVARTYADILQRFTRGEFAALA